MYTNHPVPKGERKTLLAHDGEQGKGVLAPELPGIYQWVYGREQDDDNIRPRSYKRTFPARRGTRERGEPLLCSRGCVRSRHKLIPGSYVGSQKAKLVEAELDGRYIPSIWCTKSSVRHVGAKHTTFWRRSAKRV